MKRGFWPLFCVRTKLMEIQKILPVIGFTLILLAIDAYAFQAFKGVIPATARKWAVPAFWAVSFGLLSILIYLRIAGQAHVSRLVLLFTFSTFFIIYLSKIIICLFLLVEDISRGGIIGFNWIRSLIESKPAAHSPARSAALAKIAFSVAAVPFFSLIYGMVKGAYKYQVRNVQIPIRDLPEAFEGLKIVQISDIHSGSFYDKAAVQKGIDMILAQKPDLVFFTGDLVNNEATEIVDYLPVFSQVKAPMGVFSVLGNHDYGDYKMWPSEKHKKQNLATLKQHHATLGWRLLMDEHVVLKKGNDELAVIGIQNWGAKGNFPKYGDLHKAYTGAEHHRTKLLLSHDPSHWDAQVIKHFPGIDAMFAGHTHGMQFGIEIPGFKWSPVQYMYKQWAGLYSQGHQHLYVNRGFGFIGYPGRVGIWPEISVIELTRSDHNKG